MNNKYQESELLSLSGIQHMAFCPRQFALIHIEQAWAENVRTIEGKHLHERADKPFEDETRKDIRTVRAVPLVSYTLGLRGIADVVEFHRTELEDEGLTVKLKNRKGWWRPCPVEYKRGRPKVDDRDAVQLCAQGIALEEMLHIKIDSGYIYYGQTRHRQAISFTNDLRYRVVELAENMHRLMDEGITPKAQYSKNCSLCSLVEICQPKLTLNNRSVQEYLQQYVKLEVNDI